MGGLRKRALFLVIVATVSALAQDKQELCSGNTYQVGVCLTRQYKIIDAEMTATFFAAMKAAASDYTPSDIRNWKLAQRRWIAYRDAECKAEYGLWGGGSGGPNALKSCLINLTKERSAHLKETFYLSK